jgi:hypothetical protein
VTKGFHQLFPIANEPNIGITGPIATWPIQTATESAYLPHRRDLWQGASRTMSASRSRHPPRHRLASRAVLAVLALGCAAAAVACGIGIRRDYTTIPVGQVGFDDMCGLQDYFDTIEARMAEPPAVVSAVDIEAQANRRIQGGKNRFAFDSEFQLKHLRRVLNDNWKGLPDNVASANRLDLEVHWSERAGVRRVVTASDAELIIGRESFALPYHVCLSELLYGDPLYHQRREMLGLQLPYKTLLGDAGVTPAPAENSYPTAATPPAAYDGGPPAPLTTNTLAPAALAARPASPAAARPAAPTPAAGLPSASAASGSPSAPTFKSAPPAQ